MMRSTRQIRHVRSAVVAVMPTLLLCACGSEVERPIAKAAGNVGESRDAEGGLSPWFEEVAERVGVEFVYESGATGDYLFPEIMGGGAALVDLDNDGWLDLYLVQGGKLTAETARNPGNQIYRNRGDGTFEDVTAGSGADDRGYGMGVAAGDYDNDGFIDLYVTNVGRNTLLRNRGSFRFEDVTARSGAGDPGWGSSAAFVDVDHDGWLDLFVVNYITWSPKQELRCYNASGDRDYCSPNTYNASAPDALLRNLGDGTFDDVSSAAGIRAAYGNGLGVVCADFNRDGWIDIYVANDQNENQLWENQGDGSFRNMAVLKGVAVDRHGEPKAGMGVHTADISGDGRSDLIVVNLRNQSDSFHRNEGDYFEDDTMLVGLGNVTRPYTRFGVALLDFDHDGWLDYFVANGRVVSSPDLPMWTDDPYAEPNVLLRGGERGRFDEVLPRGGTDPVLYATSRAAAFGDIDGDGAIDIVIVNRDAPAHVLRNIAPQRGNWIMFRAIDQHGRDAMHATLEVTVGERTFWRDVRSAYSYQAANDPRVHLGLGVAHQVDEVVVTWPDGATERFGAFEANQTVTLRYGAGR